MVRQLMTVLEEKYATGLAASAFPAENLGGEQLEKGNETFDAIVDDEDLGIDAEIQAQEHEMLEEIALPGMPTPEAERKRKWLQLPRPARVAIRRLHNQFGHKTKETLIEILKAYRASAPLALKSDDSIVFLALGLRSDASIVLSRPGPSKVTTLSCFRALALQN